jgi:hypothetical protein
MGGAQDPAALDGLDPGSRTLVEVGGLARTDAGNFGTEFARLSAELRIALNAAPAAVPVPAAAGRD